MATRISTLGSALTWVAVATLATALGGCSAQRTAQIAPTALPALGESDYRSPEGWHETTQRDGEALTLRGPISGVRVVSEGPSGTRDVTFTAPFEAYIGDPDGLGAASLVVRDDEHAESFAAGPDTRLHVFVRYEDEGAARSQRGGWYLLGGTAALGVFAFNAKIVADGPDEGAGAGYVMAAGMAIISGVTGLVLTGSGAYVLSTDPKRPTSQEDALELRVGPTAASLQLTF